MSDHDYDYTYNEDQAAHADDNASRLDTSGAYLGVFTRAEAVTSQSGTQGILFEFDGGSGGRCEFTIWTRKADGGDAFGMNFLQAIMLMFGLRGLRAVEGRVMRWDEEAGERTEQDGKVFPDLCNKRIGLVLQKELTTKKSGGDSYRMNLYGVYHAESKLTASEIRERKVQPAKLDKLLKSLKDRDSRKADAAPAPAMNLPGGF